MHFHFHTNVYVKRLNLFNTFVIAITCLLCHNLNLAHELIFHCEAEFVDVLCGGLLADIPLIWLNMRKQRKNCLLHVKQAQVRHPQHRVKLLFKTGAPGLRDLGQSYRKQEAHLFCLLEYQFDDEIIN